jgi:hypothetical protein
VVYSVDTQTVLLAGHTSLEVDLVPTGHTSLEVDLVLTEASYQVWVGTFDPEGELAVKVLIAVLDLDILEEPGSDVVVPGWAVLG